MAYVVHPHVGLTRLSDALELISRKMPSSGEYGPAKIRAEPMGLPDFTSLTLVSVWSPLDHSGDGVVIQIASAQELLARKAISPALHRLPIQAINDASVDELHNVTLEDGAHIYDVRFVPQFSLGDLTSSEWKALYWALAFHDYHNSTKDRSKRGAKAICPFYFDGKISYPELRERLNGLEVTGLKQLTTFIHDVRSEQPSLPLVATETLRTALQKAGLRKPKFQRSPF